VSRVRPVGSLNALFFLLIEVISQILPMVRKRGGTSTLGVFVAVVVTVAGK
jgi:hypothetical protein